MAPASNMQLNKKQFIAILLGAVLVGVIGLIQAIVTITTNHYSPEMPARNLELVTYYSVNLILLATGLVLLSYKLTQTTSFLGTVLLIVNLFAVGVIIANVQFGPESLFITDTLGQGKDSLLFAIDLIISFALAGVFLMVFNQQNIYFKHFGMLLLLIIILLELSTLTFQSFLDTSTLANSKYYKLIDMLNVGTIVLWAIIAISYIKLRSRYQLINYYTTTALLSFIIIMGLFALLSYSIRQQEISHLNLATQQIKNTLAKRFSSIMKSKWEGLADLANKWYVKNGTITSTKKQETTEYITNNSGVKGLLWLDTNQQIKWSKMDDRLPITRHQLQQQLKRFDPLFDKIKTNMRQITISPTFDANNSVYVLMIYPLKQTQHQNYMVALFDTTMVVRQLGQLATRNGYHIKLVDTNPKSQHFTNNKANLNTQNKTKLAIGNLTWYFEIVPAPNTIKIYFSALPINILLLGLIIALLLTLLIATWHTLESTLEEYYLILNSAGDGIYALDLNGNTTMVNPAAEKMLGWHDQSLIGYNMHDIVHSKTLAGNPYPKDQCPILTVLNDQKPKQGDDEIFWRKNGEIFNIEYNCKPIIKNNKLQGAVITFQDITERKHLQQKLLDQTQQLENANKELESFSYSVSHDLRTPLRHIIGFIDLIKKNEQVSLDDKAKRHFDTIIESAHQMAKLIDDLLAFSRAGRFEIHKTQCNLYTIIQEVKAELLMDTENRQIQWDIKQLPNVCADRDMIKRVMQNLISNALKFTRERDVAIITIEGEYRSQTDDHIIKVSDNGVGFDDHNTEKIFGVFERLHENKQFEGTGIGLANAARIINRHGGKINATSKIDQGTTVYFILPANSQGV